MTPVDLTGPEPKVVLTGLSSPLAAGSTITMIFNFARAGSVTIGVPVERNQDRPDERDAGETDQIGQEAQNAHGV